MQRGKNEKKTVRQTHQHKLELSLETN